MQWPRATATANATITGNAYARITGEAHPVTTATTIITGPTATRSVTQLQRAMGTAAAPPQGSACAQIIIILITVRRIAMML
jgi:hypothetical protein